MRNHPTNIFDFDIPFNGEHLAETDAGCWLQCNIGFIGRLDFDGLLDKASFSFAWEIARGRARVVSNSVFRRVAARLKGSLVSICEYSTNESTCDRFA